MADRISEGAAGTRKQDEAVPLIAVVDDDTSVRHSTCRLVRSLGFRAEAFESGEAFLGSNSAQRAACLLLDLRMPGMDGLEVQRRLAERGARIPIVFLTARASDEEEQRARSAGALAFLRKPAAEATLAETLRTLFHTPQRMQGDGDGDDQ